jgi:DNA replicative helicase MCM subunit Mcm2 (Cdc46/Mcm family)
MILTEEEFQQYTRVYNCIDDIPTHLRNMSIEELSLENLKIQQEYYRMTKQSIPTAIDVIFLNRDDLVSFADLVTRVGIHTIPDFYTYYMFQIKQMTSLIELDNISNMNSVFIGNVALLLKYSKNEEDKRVCEECLLKIEEVVKEYKMREFKKECKIM